MQLESWDEQLFFELIDIPTTIIDNIFWYDWKGELVKVAVHCQNIMNWAIFGPKLGQIYWIEPKHLIYN